MIQFVAALAAARNHSSRRPSSQPSLRWNPAVDRGSEVLRAPGSDPEDLPVDWRFATAPPNFTSEVLDLERIGDESVDLAAFPGGRGETGCRPRRRSGWRRCRSDPASSAPGCRRGSRPHGPAAKARPPPRRRTDRRTRPPGSSNPPRRVRVARSTAAHRHVELVRRDRTGEVRPVEGDEREVVAEVPGKAPGNLDGEAAAAGGRTGLLDIAGAGGAIGVRRRGRPPPALPRSPRRSRTADSRRWSPHGARASAARQSAPPMRPRPVLAVVKRTVAIHGSSPGVKWP